MSRGGTRRTTVDVNIDLHERILRHCLDQSETIRGLFHRLFDEELRRAANGQSGEDCHRKRCHDQFCRATR